MAVRATLRDERGPGARVAPASAARASAEQRDETHVGVDGDEGQLRGGTRRSRARRRLRSEAVRDGQLDEDAKETLLGVLPAGGVP